MPDTSNWNEFYNRKPAWKHIVIPTLSDMYYRMFVRARRPHGEMNKNLDISHIYIGALENIPWGRASALNV